MARKTPHHIFVEEERYNWATPRSGRHRQLAILAVVIIMVTLCVGLLR